MVTIRSTQLLLCFAVLTILAGCGEPSVDEKNLVTIEYVSEPFRTFRISGTDIQGVELEQLTEVLTKHKAKHPDAIYQFSAEVKSVPETEDEIRKAIRDAGIDLQHFWVPVSTWNPDIDLSDQEIGRVDLVGNKN